MPPEKTTAEKGFRFDVAFSFAGPHRKKVKAIAELVAAKLGRERVLFDEWYEHEILGDDMDVLLQRFYHEQSLIVVADVSDEYAERPWTRAEARAIRALRIELDPARDETGRLRLLNARFGAGTVPGVFETTAYLDGINKTAEQCAELILKRHALLTQRIAGEPAVPLAESGTSAVVSRVTSTYALPANKILFFHPATNDALYSRRERELDWLDACAEDPRIRIATVTGVGGLGKTSLVGHWIDVRQGWQRRAFRGIFFYSFYSDREAEHFFAAFIAFACKSLELDRPDDGAVPHHAAATLAQRWPFLVVLDGLEVLQADAEDSHHGWINDGKLNEFVSRLGEKGQSLLVLTSRFPFPEVTRQFPEHARPLELDMFSPEEGADLLEMCGLPEDQDARTAFSEQFGGHPLALRLFAGASLTAPATPPFDLSQEVMRAERVSTLPDPEEPGITDSERERRRHRRQFQKLLEWLQAKLSLPKRRLIQLVALFREPVPTVTLTALATGLDVMKPDFLDCDSARILSLLDALVRAHLLQREDVPGSDTARWAAHPIVREVFRAEALKAGDTVAAQFAEIVAGKADSGIPKSVAELQPILEAIEVLLAAGNFKSADELYRGRLERGLVFQKIPAPQEGLRCARGFMEPKERRAVLERELGRGRLAFYLNALALEGSILGEVEEVARGFQEHNKLKHANGDWKNVSIGLQNLADVQMWRGTLREAVETAGEAIFYAGAPIPPSAGCHLPVRPWSVPSHNPKQEKHSRTYRAHALSLLGELCAASGEFVAADTIGRRGYPENHALYSIGGIRWSYHRFRLGDITATRSLIAANRTLCESYEWKDDLARCDLILGELDLKVGDLDSAARRIGEAVRVFRGSRLGRDLAAGLLAQARLRRSVEDCEEALRLAARSGLALIQCDAFNLRAQLRRGADQPVKGIEDAREALEIAERCEYCLGRHEALRELRDGAKAIGNRADERHWGEAERQLSERMQPLIEGALAIERAHDREMENLYRKKKRSKD